MYTERMHKRLREIVEKHYGEEIRDGNGSSLGRAMSFSDVSDLLDEIERIQKGTSIDYDKGFADGYAKVLDDEPDW